METTSHSLLWLIFSRLSLAWWPLAPEEPARLPSEARRAQGAFEECMDGRAL